MRKLCYAISIIITQFLQRYLSATDIYNNRLWNNILQRQRILKPSGLCNTKLDNNNS